MRSCWSNIETARRSLGILMDPEKMSSEKMGDFFKHLPLTMTRLKTHLEVDHFLLLVGGSTMNGVDMDQWVHKLTQFTDLPVILFPGDYQQITEKAHALLFLNLISGRNPEYLVGQQVKAASKLHATDLEVIPTAYLLIDGKNPTAVQRVSQTTAMPQDDLVSITNTALAGQLMGNRLVYLEAGSGAQQSVAPEIIQRVSQLVDIPVIVGGGLRHIPQMKEAYQAGAKMLVIGTAIEENVHWKG